MQTIGELVGGFVNAQPTRDPHVIRQRAEPVLRYLERFAKGDPDRTAERLEYLVDACVMNSARRRMKCVVLALILFERHKEEKKDWTPAIEWALKQLSQFALSDVHEAQPKRVLLWSALHHFVFGDHTFEYEPERVFDHLIYGVYDLSEMLTD